MLPGVLRFANFDCLLMSQHKLFERGTSLTPAPDALKFHGYEVGVFLAHNLACEIGYDGNRKALEGLNVEV
jgi:hypothetical protein